MYELRDFEVDTKEVKEKLEGTSLNMYKISKRMMNAVNKEVLKMAKATFRNNFNPRNHSFQYNTMYKGKIKPILSSFQYDNAKNRQFVSYVRNLNYASVFLSYGANIAPRHKKYLTFKVDGERWIKTSKIIHLEAKPFLKPALDYYYNEGPAVDIMDKVLKRELDKYWNKDKPIVDEIKDNQKGR